MLAPAAFLQLVLDQLVLRQRVGHAQQRFGKHHQRQALLGGKPVFPEEILHAADRSRIAADRLDHAPGTLVDRNILGGRKAQAFGETMQQAIIVTGKWSVEQGKRRGNLGRHEVFSVISAT